MNPWASSELLASLGLPLGEAGFHRKADGRLMRVVRLQLRPPPEPNSQLLHHVQRSSHILDLVPCLPRVLPHKIKPDTTFFSLIIQLHVLQTI